MAFRFLHTNDSHGNLTEERAERLLPLRESVDAYFDSGDSIKAGNLGVPIRTEPVWAQFQRLRCDASVLGNRETHILESAFHAKLQGSHHPVLCANLRRKDGFRPLPSSILLEREGVRIGVFGVMVPMVTEKMRTKAASAYLWDQPLETAVELAQELRPQVDLLVALTHIGHRLDRELAARTGEIDIILGGHSHTVLHEPERIGNTFVCQGGSHCRFVGVYEWMGRGEMTGGLQPFP